MKRKDGGNAGLGRRNGARDPLPIVPLLALIAVLIAVVLAKEPHAILTAVSLILGLAGLFCLLCIGLAYGKTPKDSQGGLVVLLVVGLALVFASAELNPDPNKARDDEPTPVEQTAPEEPTDGFSFGGTNEDCSVLTGDEYDTCYAANQADDATCDVNDGEVVCTDAGGTEIRP